MMRKIALAVAAVIAFMATQVAIPASAHEVVPVTTVTKAAADTQVHFICLVLRICPN